MICNLVDCENIEFDANNVLILCLQILGQRQRNVSFKHTAGRQGARFGC